MERWFQRVNRTIDRAEETMPAVAPDATLEEIWRAIGLSESDIILAMQTLKLMTPDSLDRTPYGCDGKVLGDSIPSSDEKVEDKVEQTLLKEYIDALFRECLTDRQQRIINLLFGRNGEREHTPGEVGREFSVSRVRIGQIKKEAIRKIRPLAICRLQGYY